MQTAASCGRLAVDLVASEKLNPDHFFRRNHAIWKDTALCRYRYAYHRIAWTIKLPDGRWNSSPEVCGAQTHMSLGEGRRCKPLA